MDGSQAVVVVRMCPFREGRAEDASTRPSFDHPGVRLSFGNQTRFRTMEMRL